MLKTSPNIKPYSDDRASEGGLLELLSFPYVNMKAAAERHVDVSSAAVPIRSFRRLPLRRTLDRIGAAQERL
jgi:hypothetical protein